MNFVDNNGKVTTIDEMLVKQLRIDLLRRDENTSYLIEQIREKDELIRTLRDKVIRLANR